MASLSNSLALAFRVALMSAYAGASCAQVSITTYHYDNLRTGWNRNETILNQTNVNNQSFGLLKTVVLDDQVDAQPLIVAGVSVNGSKHTLVYIVTENNSVYAIDASTGQVLLQTDLGAPVYYTNLPAGCNNNGPNVGIESTPVIDPSSGTLYVIAYTWENNAPVYRIHALSLATLADIVAPVEITASGMLSDGSTYQFNPGASRQRAALLLSNNTVYAGFGSFCDAASDQSRGWVLGWQAGTLAPLVSNKLANTRATSPNSMFLSSIWMSGYGLAANPAGSVYFVTGNSDISGKTYNAVTNIEESAAEMSPDLSTLQSLFTPSDHRALDYCDCDFGSGGLMLLPKQPNKPADLAVAAGKDGNLYLLNAKNLKRKFGSYYIGDCWCGPSYFEGSDGIGRIVTSGYVTASAWTVSYASGPALVQQWQSSDIANGQDWGFFTSVSSNGTNAGSAIVWAVGRPTDTEPAYITLYAFDADTGQQLFAETAGQWLNVTGDANIVPVVANGLVYVASDQMLTIFGEGGSRAVTLPSIRHPDTRAPLPPGHHELYGTVESMRGAQLVIRRRSGEHVRLTATEALRKFMFAEPAIGHSLIARGTLDKSGVFQADVILHAKDRPAMWPPDR